MKVQCKLCDKICNLGRLQVHLESIHHENIIEYYKKYINLEITTKCPICQKDKKFIGFTYGFSKTCGNQSCSAKLTNILYKEKQKEGCKKRNLKWKQEILSSGKTRQQEIISSGDKKRKEKREETSKKISNSLKEKDSNGLTSLQRSFIKKYNVDNPMKLSQSIEKIRNTFKLKYNVNWITQLKEVKEKIKNTMTFKYRVDNFAKTEERKELYRERYKKEMIQKIFLYFNANKLELLSNINDYLTEKSSLKYKCSVCNTEYEKCWNDIQSWWSCRTCNPNVGSSSYENDINDFLTSNNIIFERHKKILQPTNLELDFFIPSLNLGIEFDGLYWHSNQHQLNDNYHLNKTKLCENKGIRLIHIFEDEWVYKKEIVLSRLRYILHLVKNKIYPRKCIVKIVNCNDKNKFLEENHIQGRDISEINIGLYYENELVSVTTFSKGNISKGSKSEDKIFELSRFCNKINYSIPGSLSKMLNFFKQNYQWKMIYSYSDIRWNTGNSYIKVGFKLDHIVSPNYWYLKLSETLKRYHRFKFRKSKLINSINYKKELTEKEIMTLDGYACIYDCGNLKFVMLNE